MYVTGIVVGNAGELDEGMDAGADMETIFSCAYPSYGIANACIVEALTVNALVLEILEVSYTVIWIVAPELRPE